jgi:hypothetical protein
MSTTAVKAFSGFEIKDADKGEVEAIIATLGVVDRDGDIIRKGAIPNGVSVTMSGWGHDAVFGSRPVGKGAVVIDGNRAIFKGRVFLNTAAGRETFEVLKEMGPTQEWSWGFHVMGDETPSEAERKQGARRVLTKTAPFEVSPVIIGAGIGTGTVAVKQADGDVAEPDRIDRRESVPDGEAAVIAGDPAAAHIAEDETITKASERIAAEVKAREEAALAAESAAVATEFDRITRNMQKYA